MARRSKQKSPLEHIVGGLVALIIFTGLVVLKILPAGFIVLAILFGAIPLVRGSREAIRDFETRKERKRLVLDKKTEGLHRTILQIAKANKGITSPTLVALNSSLTLEEADEALQAMLARVTLK